MSQPLQRLLLLLTLLAANGRLPADEIDIEPFIGVRVRTFEHDQPRPLRWCVAEIDLEAKGVRFLVSPGNGDPNGDAPGDPNNETTRETTLAFAERRHVQLAINATFFDVGVADTDNKGLVVSNGERVSPFQRSFPAINLSQQNEATIVRGRPNTYRVGRPQAGVKLYNAFSGSDQIVTDGKATTDDSEFSTALHPRTAIGYTGDKKLVLLTVDGRQPGISEGVSLAELAAMMLKFDCTDALNLDGGGSTTMVIADPTPRVLNTPSSTDASGAYGVLRQNGTSLGVFALPKDGLDAAGSMEERGVTESEGAPN